MDRYEDAKENRLDAEDLKRAGARKDQVLMLDTGKLGHSRRLAGPGTGERDQRRDRAE